VKPEPVDLSRVRTIPLETRPNKLALEALAGRPRAAIRFTEFLEGLPDVLGARDFRAIVRAIVEAKRNHRPVILAMGAHVIKVGLGPIVTDLMNRGVVSAVALNGSGAIHDSELAMIGGTSEDVAAGLKEGTFGMVRQTGELINDAVNRVLEQPERGMGDLLGERLDRDDVPFRDGSILVAGRRLGVPVTVHVAIGTDIVHMHGNANGAAIGQATFNDFRVLAGAVAQLTGGVFLNVGSAVVLPEVFLKALTVAQNLGADLHDFITVNMDRISHYRPGENVVRRPAQLGKAGYTLIGSHEIMVPLLAQAVVDELDGPGAPAKAVTLEALVALRQKYRAAKRTVVWTNGCFDIFHAGHARTLQAARALGDVLIVGLNSDRSVRALKGPKRPIVPVQERAEVLAALRCVDHVYVFDELTPENALAKLQPDIHCKGADYAPPHGKPVPEAHVVEAYGGRIAYLPLLPDVSTTDIVRRIKAES
jgi:rfaE bifunctional protein nucleotidyltransferase chain/domain